MATTPAFAYDGAVWPRGSFPTFFPLESALGIFGDRLRKQREQRGISLEAVSATTKIGIRMLRAIEDEHFDQLPGGVFNKGFIRAYARHVGLDEDEIIAEYLAVQQESQLQSQAIQPDFRQPTAKPLQPGSNFAGASSHPDTRIEEYRAEERRIEEDRRVAERRRRTTAGKKADLIPWLYLVVPLLLIMLTLALRAHHRSRAVTVGAHPGISNPTAAPSPMAKSATAEPPGPHSDNPSVQQRPATSRSAANLSELKPLPSSNQAVAPSSFTLLIRANQTSWISIVADGQPVARETLIAPAHTSVRATREIVVRVGNAAGISFLLHGKEIPGDGGNGEARTYTFDASGVRTSAGTEGAPLAQ